MSGDKIIERRFTLSSALGYDLAVVARDVVQPKAAVLMAHGFGSGKNSKYNKAVSAELDQAGISSWRFDFSGHYESGGKTEDLTIATAALDLTTVYHAMEAEYRDRPIGLVASSFGGSVALRAVQGLPHLDALCMRAPISDYAEVRRRQIGTRGIREWKRTGYIDVDSSSGPVRSGYEFFSDASRNDNYANVRNLKVPTLILWGSADETVPLGQIKKLRRVIGRSADLHIIHGADHSFSNSDHFRALVSLTADFLIGTLKG